LLPLYSLPRGKPKFVALLTPWDGRRSIQERNATDTNPEGMEPLSLGEQANQAFMGDEALSQRPSRPNAPRMPAQGDI
jgi:hypothetical protein